MIYWGRSFLRSVSESEIILFPALNQTIRQTELDNGTAMFNERNLTPAVYLARTYVANEELETSKVVVWGQ
jgi:hypothetical protein